MTCAGFLPLGRLGASSKCLIRGSLKRTSVFSFPWRNNCEQETVLVIIIDDTSNYYKIEWNRFFIVIVFNKKAAKHRQQLFDKYKIWTKKIKAHLQHMQQLSSPLSASGPNSSISNIKVSESWNELRDGVLQGPVKSKSSSIRRLW